MRLIRSTITRGALVPLLASFWSCGGPTGGTELGGCLDATAPAGTRVLVFSRTAGYRHESIGAGVDAIRALGVRHGFAVEHNENPSCFVADSLSRSHRWRLEDLIGAYLGRDIPQLPGATPLSALRCGSERCGSDRCRAHEHRNAPFRATHMREVWRGDSRAAA